VLKFETGAVNGAIMWHYRQLQMRY